MPGMVRLRPLALLAPCLPLVLGTSACRAGYRPPDLRQLYDRVAQSHTGDRNPVIVIPGILGSNLVDRATGTTVWGAFSGDYAIQGNYNGIQVWDISDPAAPTLEVAHVCPASQSDVSVYDNLLFVSGEGMTGRLDCGSQGVSEAVSHDRLRGIRIFDITDIQNPAYIGNVQTCRGSHTHTVVEHPDDLENVYIYVSGSAPVRPAEELPGCSGLMPSEDPNSALFRIEVIRVPLDNPAAAAIVSSPRIFEDLVAPPTHGLAPDDLAVIEEARARGAFIADFGGQFQVLPDRFAQNMLDSIVAARGGSGPATAADSTALREYIPQMVAQMMGQQEESDGPAVEANWVEADWVAELYGDGDAVSLASVELELPVSVIYEDIRQYR